jgi:O-antigen/teichoic acid export membrane protein
MKSKIIIFLSFFFLTTNAHAYLDPGTGSIILQAIVGAFAAFFTSIYIFWNKVKNFYKKIFNKNKKK